MTAIEEILDLSLSEGKNLDYKRTLDLNQRKEFLKDISSFLNADGGRILVGIDECDGKPEVPIQGFEFPSIDQAKLQIESIIRTGITPTIHGVQVNEHEYRGKKLIEIRIPRGYDQPYQVTFDKHDRFYIRTEAGKHPMDRKELKDMFLNTNVLRSRTKQFISDRLIDLEEDDHLYGGNNDLAAFVLHLVPQNSFSDDVSYDLREVANQFKHLYFLDSNGYPNWNNDGLIYQRGDIGPAEYIQVFRNGIIEAFSTKMVNRPQGGFDKNKSEKAITSSYFENNIIETLPSLFSILETMIVQLPLNVNLCIIKACGIQLFTGRYTYKQEGFRKDRLKMVNSQILTFDDSPITILKPIFDSLWNTFGYPESQNTVLK